MRANEFINEGLMDTLKSQYSDLKKSNPNLGTALDTIGTGAQKTATAAGDLGNLARAKLYKATGVGGEKGQQAAARDSFIDDFVSQVSQSERSARKSGMPLDMSELSDAYLQKYKWFATPAQKEQLAKITDPTQLANALWTVGSQQKRDKQGYVNDPRTTATIAAADNQAAPATGPAAGSLSGWQGGPTAAGQGAGDESTSLKPATKQVLKTIQQLKGEDSFDDIETIVKTGLRSLNKQNRAEYASLYKEIMTGKSNPQG